MLSIFWRCFTICFSQEAWVELAEEKTSATISRIWRNREALGMRYVIINLLGNILAFVPFGYLLPKIVTRKLGVFYTVLFTLEFSVFVELIQLVTRTGSFDVDDLILNTIGGLVGYTLYYRRLISGKK